jgi:hypothetical protein
MIRFTRQPQRTFTKNGLSPLPQKPQPNIGMDVNEFHRQVIDMAQKKVPLQKTHKAIEGHPDITDKNKAKRMAQGVYNILGVGKLTKKMV